MCKVTGGVEGTRNAFLYFRGIYQNEWFCVLPVECRGRGSSSFRPRDEEEKKKKKEKKKEHNRCLTEEIRFWAIAPREKIKLNFVIAVYAKFFVEFGIKWKNRHLFYSLYVILFLFCSPDAKLPKIRLDIIGNAYLHSHTNKKFLKGRETNSHVKNMSSIKNQQRQIYYGFSFSSLSTNCPF